MKVKYYFLIALTIFITELSKAITIDRIENAGNQIKSLLIAKYNATFHLECIADVDSLKTDDWVPSGLIKDPYGTLAHCFPFIARFAQADSSGYEHIVSTLKGTDDSITVFGILRGGQIIWSSTLFKGNVYTIGKIYGISDINQDGKVEIMIEWRVVGGNFEHSLLWIFTWDGTTATPIYDKQDNGVSNLENVEEIVDLNGDGILELIGYKGLDQNNITQVSYSWNGSFYGKWQNGPQIGQMKYTRADNFQATVKSFIQKVDTLYVYNYSIANNASSKQSLKYFLVADNATNTSTIPPINWKSGRLKKNKFSSFIGLSDSTWVKPGSLFAGLQVISTGLPGIMNYYIQAPHNLINVDENVPSDLELWFLSDVYTNSVKGTTISPIDISAPFIPLIFLDTLTSFTTQSQILGWIKNKIIANKYLNYFSSARTKLVQHDSVGARNILLQVLSDVNVDSTSLLTSEAYALLRFNTEYLTNKLPQAQAAPFFAVKLVSSSGIKLTGGALQYYEGSWKDATNNNDGTFSITSTAKTLSLRMTYEYGTQTKSNVPISNDTIIFQTVNAQIQLQNSSSVLIDTGTVQYYAGAWRNLGTTSNGIASKELLPVSYSFRMTYAFASNDKIQDLSINQRVIFQTVNTTVKLQNSFGSLIDQGMVQYYSGAWRDFGATSSGVVTKELLSNNYSFRMTYANASKDKQQDIGVNPTVIFQTVNATVQLKNSSGALMDTGAVQYYSGAWRSFGTTANGAANKELLPNSYSFRMTHQYISLDKSQDISTNNTVIYATVLCTINVKDAHDNPISNAQASYYSGAWRVIGLTTNGQITKELLPVNLTFRIKSGTTQQDKAQNLSTNNIVEFSIP